MLDNLQYTYDNIARWYDAKHLNTADDTLLSKGIHHFFLKNYESALLALNDLLRITRDYKMQMLLTIKIAACISYTNKEEALSILQPILHCPDAEIYSYAEQQIKILREREILSEKEPKKIEFIIQSYYGQFDEKNFI